MAQYKPVSKEQRKLLADLESSLGSRTLRTILAGENRESITPERTRIVSRKRLGNLTGGTGRLTASEAETLENLKANRQAIKALQKRGESKDRREYQTNRAIRTWLQHGKAKTIPRTKSSDEIRAIKALGFLGIDFDTGTFYLKGNA